MFISLSLLTTLNFINVAHFITDFRRQTSVSSREPIFSDRDSSGHKKCCCSVSSPTCTYALRKTRNRSQSPMTKASNHCLQSMSIANCSLLPAHSANFSTIPTHSLPHLRSRSKTIVPLTISPPTAFACTAPTLPTRRGTKASHFYSSSSSSPSCSPAAASTALSNHPL